MSAITRRSLVIAGGTVLAAPALAQNADWPSKEIRLIVSVAPGGGADLVARQVARVIAQDTGGTVVVRNIVGGSGLTGMAEMASSPPDGYTLSLVNIGSLLVLPHIMQVPFSWDDLAFLGGISQNYYGVAVAANSPWQTFGDMIATGKTRRITYACATIMNGVALVQAGNQSGARFRLVNTQTDAEAITQTVGGFVDIAMTSSTVLLPMLQSQRLKLLAVTPARWPNMPDIPTVKEAGYNGETVVPLGFACPAGVPAPIRARFEAAILKAARDPATVEMLTRTINMPKPMTGAEFRHALFSQAPTIEAMLAEAGMKRR
ncbi:Bug family tripartite tricarboxylate transporter substrate binding protein [Falsiroseomonas bella]|nr:tripartite tricarboxylate transporter substrate binding protein [Falsiroseomonas bella]